MTAPSNLNRLAGVLDDLEGSIAAAEHAMGDCVDDQNRPVAQWFEWHEVLGFLRRAQAATQIAIGREVQRRG